MSPPAIKLAQAKANDQLPGECALARQLSDEIIAALRANTLSFSAALPRQVFPPLFNRYGDDMTFGNHVVGAIRTHAPSRTRIRADLSATLFLSAPDSYDGGELLVEDTFGTHRVKLRAGNPA